MLRYMKRPVWGFILLALFPAGLAAQTVVNKFVYTNNDLVAGNSVSAFSVGANGALSAIAGSPFTTGGTGTGKGLYASNRIIVVKGSVSDLLFASNSGSNDVSAFTIDSSTGVLTAVSGSPFSTGSFNDSSQSGISLAATPDGKYLYAGSTGLLGQITIFSIDSTGALTIVDSSPVAAGGPMSSLKVSPDGKFLAVAIYGSSELAMFAIQSDGSLQPVTNSPFVLSSGSATGEDINCASNLLFAGGPTGNIYAFNIASDGELSAVAGSPFATGATGNQVVALSTDDSILFSSNQGDNTVSAFAVGSNGSLTLPGTSVNAAGTSGTSTSPGGLAVSQDGTFLYSADANPAVSSFSLGGSSPLSFDFLTATGASSLLRSLAAYPAKACGSSPTSSGLIASLQISAGPPPAFDLEATLSLESSLAVDPLTQPVTIQIGSLSLALPAGSLKTFQSGKNMGTYLFQGNVDGTNLKLQIVALGQNQFQISAYGKQVDLTGLTGSVTVTVGIGGNSASASVTPNLGTPLRGNWSGN